MLNEMELISDAEKDDYMLSLQKELDECAISIQNICKMHKQLGFCVPNVCCANFRDSLFHYRKMSKTNEKGDILNQAYALREHMYRGIKDGMINYMQELSKRIERLYSSTNDDNKEQIEQMCEDVDEQYLHSEDNVAQILVSMTVDHCPREKMQKVFLYHYYKIPCKGSVLQKRMHEIRNVYLDIRKGSLLIERPYEKDRTVLANLIGDTIKDLKKEGIFEYVISAEILE